MFSHLFPKFEKGRILKTAMLENLRDFPREALDIAYQDYADGIITGAMIQVERDTLKIAPGILKHQGRLYLLNHSVEVPYRATGREMAVKVRFGEGKQDSDWMSHPSEIVLTEPGESGAPELELCRFKLKEGARLRQDYQNFRDLATEYNTVNLLHVRFAADGESTVSPVILRMFGEEMMRRGGGEAQDFSFAMMCLNEGTIRRNVILHYIANRLGTAYKDYSNIEIHKYLSRILDNTRGGGQRLGMSAGGSLRMIVD